MHDKEKISLKASRSEQSGKTESNVRIFVCITYMQTFTHYAMHTIMYYLILMH